MKKNKLYILLSVLIAIIFFSTSAICNKCAVSEEDKQISEILESSEEEIEDTNEIGESYETEETLETSTETEEAPTIELQIYEGPLYSQSDNICYYRIEAIVTGSPTPDVVFSRDDSGGNLGDKKVLINLSDPSDTYVLEATATNSLDTANASVSLDWQCPLPNNQPEIDEIIVYSLGDFPTVNHPYAIEVIASDPDGDSLSYKWVVSEGTIDDPNVNLTTWNTPSSSGEYEISVEVDDGNGGIAEDSVILNVYEVTELQPVSNEGGEITRNEAARPGNPPYIGDTDTNEPVRGYISFDIASLAGTEIAFARATFEGELLAGDNPTELVEAVWLEVVDWGNGQIESNDYNLSGILLDESRNPHFSCIDGKLLDELEEATGAGKDRFQLRIRHKGFPTDNDNMADGWSYQNITLLVYYK
jgi:hypothetical protein